MPVNNIPWEHGYLHSGVCCTPEQMTATIQPIIDHVKQKERDGGVFHEESVLVQQLGRKQATLALECLRL